MKKIFAVILFMLLSVAFLVSANVGKIYIKSNDGPEGENLIILQSETLNAFVADEIKKGNLRLLMVQEDPIASMEHHRYTQYFKGLEVFGGQIIQHYRNGGLIGINGEFYEIEDVDTVPAIAKEEVVEIFRQDLSEEGLRERSEESKLLIFPVKDGDYHLAYKVILEKEAGYSMTGIIDARTGELLLKYSNIHFDDLTIGLGVGYHNEEYKLATTLYEGYYYLADEKKARPVNQYTVDWNIGGYVPTDKDNYWDSDGPLVNAHAFVGWIYDYYYLVHGREGINNKNMDIIINVNDTYYSDNAYWWDNKIWLCVPGPSNHQTAAALDVVAHEYTHGVTQFTSNLVYQFESGALNESFSDIMGTAVEFYHQPQGNALLKADWYFGEDMTPNYKTTGCRNLANPNSNWQSFYGPDPCHLSQYIYDVWWIDYGGVHLNSTIYSHAYYLLANGGKNKVSQKRVNGIGIKKATKIFYRAWVYYMGPNSGFWHAANNLLWAADHLYGSGSNEFDQTVKAMEAIGWIVE